MSIQVRIKNEFVDDAKIKAKIEFRSYTDQIELWISVGRAVMDNPDLPGQFIIDTLMARREEAVDGFEFR